MAKKESAEATVRNIRRNTRKKYGAEEKIRIVLEGLKGESTIAEFRRQIQRDDVLPANRYYAIAKESPGVESGTEVDVVDAWHLLIGYY